MNKRFSIITCTHNSDKFLKENIESVKSQTFDDYEHVFVDGESADNTISILSDYQSSNPNKVIIVQRKANGIADAMNTGIDVANGEYIIHLHSDDYLHDQNVLMEVNEFLLKNNPDWTYSKEILVDVNGDEIKAGRRKLIFRHGYKNFFLRNLLKYYCYIGHQAVFIKKSVFERFGNFDTEFKGAMDHEYWLRIRNKTRWIFFDRVVDCFRVHENGMSSSISTRNQMLIEEMQVVRKYSNYFEFYIIRFLFKIIAVTFISIREQIDLYKRYNSITNK